MGTNYYLYEKPDCKCCNRPFDPKHIGKSSMGWCFLLHVIPEDNINNLQDWIDRWMEPQCIIKNEYGDLVAKETMLKTITERKGNNDFKKPCLESFDTKTWNDFHRKNHSESGPNGLLRSEMSLRSRCIGYGSGTWDLIEGEFS